MENKRQHIVPRAYLAAFVDPATPPGLEPYLWIYDRDAGEPYRRAPKKVSVASYYFSFTAATGERDDAVDEMLQIAESRAMPIVRALDQGRQPNELSLEERAHLAHFVALFEVRLPRFRNTLHTFIAEVMGDMALVAASHPKYFARTAREAAAAKGREAPSSADIESLRQFILSKEYSLQTSPVMSLQAMVQLAPLVSEYVYNFEWRILEASGDAAFITSDGPLVRVTTMANHPRWMGVGWETPYMEATLPLSPRTCMVISLHHPEGRESVSDDQVREVNHRTSAYALDSIYSSRPLTLSDLTQAGEPVAWRAVTDALK